MDNLNILVEAKKEYLGQLCLIMCPAMIEVFSRNVQRIYQNLQGEAGSHHVSEIIEGSSQLVKCYV